MIWWLQSGSLEDPWGKAFQSATLSGSPVQLVQSRFYPKVAVAVLSFRRNSPILNTIQDPTTATTPAPWCPGILFYLWTGQSRKKDSHSTRCIFPAFTQSFRGLPSLTESWKAGTRLEWGTEATGLAY